MLGDLGQLKIVPLPAYMVPIGGCLITVEIFPDDPDTDPQWEEKYRLLELMVNVCTAVLPEEKAVRTPMVKAPVAREQRRCYLRCMECRHTGELHTLVSQLTDEQYPLLLEALHQARITASNQECLGLQQRLDEVQDLWVKCHP
jgi:hypothetical protein